MFDLINRNTVRGGNPVLTKFGAGQPTDRKGRFKEDAEGNFIPRDQRRSKAAVRRNPFGINAGNAVDPDVSFFDDVLANANPSFGINQQLLSLLGGQA